MIKCVVRPCTSSTLGLFTNTHWDLGNSEELSSAVLLIYGLKDFLLVSQVDKVADLMGRDSNVALFQLRYILDGLGPGSPLLKHFLSEVEGGAGHPRRQPLVHVNFNEAELAEVTGQDERLLTCPSHAAEPLQETVDGWERDFIRQLLQDLEFLFQYLFLGVGVVCDVDEIVHLRHVDLFILASDEHGADAEQLVLAPRDALLLAVAIDQVYCDVERLGLELILQVHLNEPRHENSSHSIRQIRLVLTSAGRFGQKNGLSAHHVIRTVVCHF